MTILDSNIRPYQILVVDDIPAERFAIIDVVKDVVPSAEFVEADGVESAKNALRTHVWSFDLAVIDLRLLNNAEGLELLGAGKPICERDSQTRIIVYTGIPTVETACDAFENGVDAYLSKLDVDSRSKLQRKVKELLCLQTLRQDLCEQREAQRQAEATVAARQGLIEKFGGKFVLLHGDSVIGASDSPEELRNSMKRISIVRVPTKEENSGTH